MVETVNETSCFGIMLTWLFSGSSGRHLDQGWNVQGGCFGFNFGPYVGAMIDVGYNRFGISSATLDPIVHLNPHGHADGSFHTDYVPVTFGFR